MGLEWYFFFGLNCPGLTTGVLTGLSTGLRTGVDHNGEGLARKDWTAPGLGMALLGWAGLDG